MKNSILIALLYFAAIHLTSCESSTTPKETPQEETSQNKEDKAGDTTKPTVSNDLNSPVYGLDLSKHQGAEIEYIKNHKEQFNFIICKATEGVGYHDPDFRLNWKTIPELGLVRGAYHFYRTKDNPIHQANYYASQIKDITTNDIPPIIDFEETSFKSAGPQSIAEIQKDILLFLKTVEEKLNRKPMIYTDNNIGNKYLNHPDFGKYALWIANYEARTEPLLPKAWRGTKWLFWQKTGHYMFDGKKNDFDAFNGSRADLEAFIETY